MIRATTGGVLKSYRSNLMNSFISLNKACDTVLSQRVFNSYAEDPAAAAKAFKLRKSRMSVESQYDICNDAYRKYQTAWSCLDSVDKLIDTDNGKALSTLKGTTLKMLNDPTGDAREQLAEALDQMSETIVQTLNQKYGDNFIFAGADGHNVPFEVRQVDGQNKLFYRGVDVDAAVPETMKDAAGADIRLDKDGNIDMANGTSYLAADAEMVNAPATDAAGNVIKVKDGKLDAAGDNLMTGYTTITKADYEALVKADPNAPETNVLKDADGTTLYEVKDKDGNDAYIIIGTYDTMTDAELQDLKDSAIQDGTAPYMVKDENGDDCYIINSKDSIISEAEYEKACSDVEKLKYLANEKYFVDIGLGFQENEKGNLIEASGFNASLVGLNFIGYGKDADGEPKNIYSLVQRMKEVAGRIREGEEWSNFDYEEFNGLVKKLEGASSSFKTAYTNMDAGTTKLKNNLSLLEENFYNLQEQYADLEDADMAESITSFIWAQYCYNAALKVGNSILSESLMDYLN